MCNEDLLEQRIDISVLNNPKYWKLFTCFFCYHHCDLSLKAFHINCSWTKCCVLWCSVAFCFVVVLWFVLCFVLFWVVLCCAVLFCCVVSCRVILFCCLVLSFLVLCFVMFRFTAVLLYPACCILTAVYVEEMIKYSNYNCSSSSIQARYILITFFYYS